MSMIGGGGGFAGSQRSWQSGGDNFPFAGIPPEIARHADKLLSKEPPVSELDVGFDHRVSAAERRSFSLRRFLAPQWLGILVILSLVAAEVYSGQIGPDLARRAIDRGVLRKDTQYLILIAALYLGSLIGNALLHMTRTMLSARVGEGLLFKLRVRIFSHLQRLSMDFYEREMAGRVMTRMTSDIEALQMLFQQGLVNLVVQLGILCVVTYFMLSYNVRLAIVLLGTVVPLVLGATLWFRAVSDRAFLNVRNRIADVLADLQESLSGIRIVSMYNRQRHNTIRHRNIVGQHFDANVYGAKVQARYGPGIETLGLLGIALIIFVGHGMVQSGSLSVGKLVAFVLYQYQFFAPIQQIVQLYSTYQQGRAAITKIRDLLAESVAVPEAPDAYELPPLRGEISFEDASFGYVPGHPIIHEIDLRIEEGETFALVGPTGAGKSTIAKLTARFYDPQEGTVSIDGHDLRKVTIESLRRQLGVVPQEAYLFGGSIRDNIRFARPNATDDEVLGACRAVGIDDLVERLPNGLDTLCHERGVTLSSGERQLLALARAFMAQPRVLILDEATSNLDLATEARIERALDTLLEGRTAILIAHRLSTAMRANRIAVVDGGRIVEIGSHQELVGRGGRYAGMFATWVRQGGTTPVPRGNGGIGEPAGVVASGQPSSVPSSSSLRLHHDRVDP